MERRKRLCFMYFDFLQKAIWVGRKGFLFHFLFLVFFSFFFSYSLSFSVGGKISRIKTGSHMLLFTIGIQHNTSPTATQTGRERERQGESESFPLILKHCYTKSRLFGIIVEEKKAV